MAGSLGPWHEEAGSGLVEEWRAALGEVHDSLRARDREIRGPIGSHHRARAAGVEAGAGVSLPGRCHVAGATLARLSLHVLEVGKKL